ncbi:DHH family phosphoesterase [Candidatus Woesearchaeota archaeon]|nr:DHH family phosphoesterase [Candidatus Woesearchaeota archaeon]
MMMQSFLQRVKLEAENFKKSDSPVRIISHLDADGLSSAAIITKALKRLNRKFSLTIVKQLSQSTLKQFKSESYETFLFVDLGSGNIQDIKEAINSKSIIILDHHQPQEIENAFIHLNPILFGLDGNKDVSGAGLAYLFAKSISEENNDLSTIALIGAIGDNQEKKGFSSINSLILDDAKPFLEIITGLRMFGTQTKPLYKILQYSTDPYIPGITGDEQAAIKFLQELKLDPGKKLIHLDKEEMKTLVTSIILQRLGSEENPDDVLGPIYLLKSEPEESPMRDLREFATLLNSCGRLNKPSLGIAACLQDERLKPAAINVLNDYKKEIIFSLNWFYNNKDKVIELENLVIINAEDNIKDNLIGTLSSMIAKSNLYPENTIIISLAHSLEDKTKISIRCSGYRNNDINLKEMLDSITSKIGCQAGGHKNAAGSLIPQDKEQEFIELAKSLSTFIQKKEI